jgi:hypothetical protein
MDMLLSIGALCILLPRMSSSALSLLVRLPFAVLRIAATHPDAWLYSREEEQWHDSKQCSGIAICPCPSVFLCPLVAAQSTFESTFGQRGRTTLPE